MVAVYAVYWRVRTRGRLRLLLVASYFFYGYWDYRFLGLIALSTLIDYSVARSLERTAHIGWRRALLAISVVTNLGILSVFKYFGFFVESAQALLTEIGLRPTPIVIEILLPVGISFYTFQTMAYTVDVYRHRIAAVKDLLLFGVYVAFFPQLVAGPIERAEHLLPQLQRPARPDAARFRTALLLISVGLVKKVVIADTIAQLVNRTFSAPTTTSVVGLIAGMYGFAIQIYCDFSGYTDIARGTSRLLGVELSHNFREPYFSRSITEFWRRWHISLSSWLRDYLYIPLGGSRGSMRQTYRNLMITMALGGLWHGASWTFVIWGLLHGGYLISERRLGHVRDVDGDEIHLADIPRMLLTFHLVCLGWIFFRADSLARAWQYIVGIATFQSGTVPVEVMLLLPLVLATLAIDLGRRRRIALRGLTDTRSLRLGTAYGISALLLLVFSGGPPQPFVYFQF